MVPRVGRQQSSRWQVWVDTGGTFTDCVAVPPGGGIRRVKVLSSGFLRGRIAECVDDRHVRLGDRWQLPEDFFRGGHFRLLQSSARRVSIVGYDSRRREIELASPRPAEAGAAFEIGSGEEAPLLAARLVTGTPFCEPLPPLSMRLATTRGTNALLERKGSDTVLFVTRGFGDLLEIGSQQRPKLFELAVTKSPPLYSKVVEVEERLSADGGVLVALDPGSIEVECERLLGLGIDTASVAFLHSYRNPTHEQRLGAFLEQLGFRHVSLSSELAPRIRVLARAETAVLNAYLSRVIESYFREVGRALDAGRLHALTSAGGVVRSDRFMPKDSLLSGPAGGVVGAAHAGRRSGFERTLNFDMGGTSTDVSRFAGDFDYSFETRVAGVRLLAPSLAIETVAAGGGSVCHFDHRQLRVGPQSAGAQPGPACYGAGGPLTLTDANLLLGRLEPERFDIPIEVAASEKAVQRLQQEIREQTGERLGCEEILEGCIDIANERMAEAVRRISIRKGYRPADYVLVAFGGAGGQHACALARVLDMATVLLPAHAGLLSALGLGRARIERFRERQILQPLDAVEQTLWRWIEGLAEDAASRVAEEGVPRSEIVVRRRIVHLRLEGQESTLAVEAAGVETLAEDFRRAYEDHYGYRSEQRSIEVESIRVVASSRDPAESEAIEPPASLRAEPLGRRRVWLEGAWRRVPIFDREKLGPGATLDGPSLVFERHSGAVVERDWQASVDGAGGLVLRRQEDNIRHTTRVDKARSLSE